MLTVADVGLPIPSTTQRIDLALKPGVPGFLETLEVVLAEMFVEKACVSEDILTKSPHIYAGMQKLLGDVPIETLPHLEFKKLTGSTKAIVRTAEFTPFANVILVARARPSSFNTVRYSEKILQNAGITVMTVDLPEILGDSTCFIEGIIFFDKAGRCSSLLCSFNR